MKRIVAYVILSSFSLGLAGLFALLIVATWTQIWPFWIAAFLIAGLVWAMNVVSDEG